MRRRIPAPRRTILPGLEGPSQNTLSTEFRFTAAGMLEERVLARWSGEMSLVTIVGNQPHNDASGFTAVDTNACLFLRLEYRAGGVFRRDTYIWPAQGWVRTVAANEVAVVAVFRGDTATAGQTITAGAGITLGGFGKDSAAIMLTGNTGQLGAAEATAIVPNGMREFRAWELSLAGTFDLGVINTSGTFSAAEAGISGSDLESWRPWPSWLTAIRYNPNPADAGPAPAMVMFRSD